MVRRDELNRCIHGHQPFGLAALVEISYVNATSLSGTRREIQEMMVIWEEAGMSMASDLYLYLSLRNGWPITIRGNAEDGAACVGGEQDHIVLIPAATATGRRLCEYPR